MFISSPNSKVSERIFLKFFKVSVNICIRANVWVIELDVDLGDLCGVKRKGEVVRTKHLFRHGYAVPPSPKGKAHFQRSAYENGGVSADLRCIYNTILFHTLQDRKNRYRIVILTKEKVLTSHTIILAKAK